jgi:hypothetical protein
MLVITAAQDAEVRGSWFEDDLGKKLLRPCFKTKPCVVVCACGLSYLEGRSRRMVV